MSDDILDWLKHWSTYPSVKETYGSNIIRAAEEIERLRAENEKLQAKCEFIYDEFLEAKGKIEKLRAAIFEKETVMQIRAAAAAALKETDG